MTGKLVYQKKKIMNEEVLKSKLGCENQQNSLKTSGNEVIIILADILFSPLYTNNVMLQQIGQFRWKLQSRRGFEFFYFYIN